MAPFYDEASNMNDQLIETSTSTRRIQLQRRGSDLSIDAPVFVPLTQSLSPTFTRGFERRGSNLSIDAPTFVPLTQSLSPTSTRGFEKRGSSLSIDAPTFVPLTQYSSPTFTRGFEKRGSNLSVDAPAFIPRTQPMSSTWVCHCNNPNQHQHQNRIHNEYTMSSNLSNKKLSITDEILRITLTSEKFHPENLNKALRRKVKRNFEKVPSLLNDDFPIGIQVNGYRYRAWSTETCYDWNTPQDVIPSSTSLDQDQIVGNTALHPYVYAVQDCSSRGETDIEQRQLMI